LDSFEEVGFAAQFLLSAMSYKSIGVSLLLALKIGLFLALFRVR
jgi:hypothetical protein